MLRHVRRIAVGFVGGIVVAVGVVMVVLPGPAILVIPAGLAILATEFQWARHLLQKVRHKFDRGLTVVKRRRSAEPASSQAPGRSEPSRSSELRAS